MSIPSSVAANTLTGSISLSIASGSRCRKLSPRKVPAAKDIKIKVKLWRFLPLTTERSIRAESDIKETSILAINDKSISENLR